MRFYRPWQPVAALSFDLDDTLYDNRPVMVNAENGLIAYLRQQLQQPITMADYQLTRRQVLAGQPVLANDVSRLRRATVKVLAEGYGWHGHQAEQLGNAAFNHFLQLRNQVQVPAESYLLLDWLAARYPLVAITNGNVDVAGIGLARYFRAVLHAGDGWPMKPARPLFAEAERRLGVSGKAILHVGDHADTDVRGALLAGWQAAWINHPGMALPKLLPTLALDGVDQLYSLLG